MSFIAGKYHVKYGATGSEVYMGQTDGLNLTYSFSEAAIRGDNFGDSWQDGVYRGGNCFVNLNLMKYTAPSILTTFWPMSATFGQSGVIGRLGSALAKSLVLEAALGTPAHTATAPRIMTAKYAVLTPGVPVELDLSPRLRTIPLQLQLLPYAVGSSPNIVNKWFATLASGATAAEPDAVGAFIAGKYDVTYGGTTVGQTDGVRIGWRMHGQPVTGDNFGDSVQDFIYRGADVWISMVLMEYNQAQAREAFWPYAVDGGEPDLGLTGTIGRLNSGLTQALVLTALAGTPAAASPATITVDKAILAPGHQIQLLLDPNLRTVPIRFNCVPQGSPTEWFVTT